MINVKKMKIIHVQLLPLLSGVQKVTLDEMERLDPTRFDKILICKCPGELTDRLSGLGVRFNYISDLKRDISPINDIRAFFALVKVFLHEKPDIVHSHSSKTGILARFAAYISRVPKIIHTVHGFSFPAESRFLVRSLYYLLEYMAGKITTKLIVLNDEDLGIAAHTLGIPKTRIVLLPNGVDCEVYRPPILCERDKVRKLSYGIDDNKFILIGMVGRLWRQKNPQCFFDAATIVLSSHKNVFFYFIGDGEMRDEIEGMISSHHLSSNVHIMGWRSDVPMLLRGLDIMVLPSRWEGMPLSILEAMASGLPVVVSDIPGNNHIVSHNINGLLFSPEDSNHLARLLLDLIDNKDRRFNISSRARADIIASYRLEGRISSVISLYQS